jgi:hypothetical protein
VLLVSPALDIGSEPELDATLAEVEHRLRHVAVPLLILQHGVAVSEATGARSRPSRALSDTGSGSCQPTERRERDAGIALLDALIDQFAEHLAERVAASLAGRAITKTAGRDEWFDSRHAVDYLGCTGTRSASDGSIIAP